MNDTDTPDTQPWVTGDEHANSAVRPSGLMPSETIYVDVYENPTIEAVYGSPIKAGSPWEGLADAA